MPFGVLATVVTTRTTRGEKISAHGDRGPRSRVCARETLRSAPHGHEWEFFVARVCRITFKHLPQLLRTHIQSFRGVPEIYFLLVSSYFCYLGTHAKN